MKKHLENCDKDTYKAVQAADLSTSKKIKLDADQPILSFDLPKIKEFPAAE